MAGDVTWDITVSPLVVVGFAVVAYVVGYRVYARYLATSLFELDGSRPTPAHTLRDDIDYVPTNRYVLFGHHYASITGLSPMTRRIPVKSSVCSVLSWSRAW